MATKAETEKQEAIERLRQWVEPGDTVYTILRSVSRSGMNRKIGIVLLKQSDNGELVDLHPNHAVSKACGYRLMTGAWGAISVNGAGMDMGFDVVYNIGRALWPDGVPCAGKKRCQSNDHVNTGPDRNNYDSSVIHQDGGYALKHRWL